MDSVELRQPVRDLLDSLRGRSLLYLPNRGNAGDSLIAVATTEAFRRAGLSPREISPSDDVKGEIVILGGGGNLVPLYDGTATALDEWAGRAGRIILLPHTIRGNEALLARLPPTAVLFCRDRVSFEHVRQTAPRATALLSHDMAFHLNADAFLNGWLRSTRWGGSWRRRLRRHRLSVSKLRKSAVIDLFRTDAEADRGSRATDMDASLAFRSDVSGPGAEKAAWCFLKTVASCQSVRTDRLHVGIAAALTGTRCQLFDNSYGKNRAVFEQSIRGRFPHVTFVDNPAAT